MPEGHTIHRLARDHHRWFAGQILQVTSPQGRFTQGANDLDSKCFLRAFAHGKHLFYEFDSEGPRRIVHIHLGLFGRFKVFRELDRKPTANVRLRLKNAARVLDLSGPTCCEILDAEQLGLVRGRLGPDPLLKEFSAEDCVRSFAKRSASIAAVLMDQKAIAGIGNIYRSELLFFHSINPDVPARQLREDTVRALWDTAVEWLNLGVKTNSILTTLAPGTIKPPRQRPSESVAIYKKQCCPRCGSAVTQYALRQRTVYVCRACQTRTQ